MAMQSLRANLNTEACILLLVQRVVESLGVPLGLRHVSGKLNSLNCVVWAAEQSKYSASSHDQQNCDRIQFSALCHPSACTNSHSSHKGTHSCSLLCLLFDTNMILYHETVYHKRANQCTCIPMVSSIRIIRPGLISGCNGTFGGLDFINPSSNAAEEWCTKCKRTGKS